MIDKKELKRIERLKRNYNLTHKIINEIDHKICKVCNDLHPATTEFFYENKSNLTDGLSTYCKDCSKKKSSKYMNENIEIYRQRAYEHYVENKEQYQSRKREWYKDNKDHVMEYTSIYQKDNPDKVKLYHDQHDNHNITNEEWENCKNYFNYRCAYCNLSIEEHLVKYRDAMIIGDFHRDHVNHEGVNDLSNCIPACKSCNTSKHDLEFENWYSENNVNFNINKLNKIEKWLNEDYKQYIKLPKPKQKYTKRHEKWFK